MIMTAMIMKGVMELQGGMEMGVIIMVVMSKMVATRVRKVVAAITMPVKVQTGLDCLECTGIPAALNKLAKFKAGLNKYFFIYCRHCKEHWFYTGKLDMNLGKMRK